VLGGEEEAIAGALDAAVEGGRAAGAKGTYMVAPAGREWLDAQYPEAFADFRVRALWNWRDMEHPTITQALAIADSLNGLPLSRTY